MDNRPIGVFDSGLGGLTGVRELRKRLPHEDIVYFGDTGRVPYGSRSPETILQYARQDIALPAFQECQVHHGGLRHGVQHLPGCRGRKAAGALSGRGGCRRPGGSLCYPEPPHRRHRHSGHHPLPQL